MNRREMITAAVVASALPVLGQQESTNWLVSVPNQAGESQPTVSAEDKRKQFAICKERGHRPTQWGNLHSTVALNSIFNAIPDHPPSPYPQVSEGEWVECWDCKTKYRFVTRMEEKETPE